MKNCKTSAFFLSDEEEDNEEFLMINSNLLDIDLEDSDGVSNATVVSKIIDNLLFPKERFYKISSQLNEGQQHLLFYNAVCIALQISRKE